LAVDLYSVSASIRDPFSAGHFWVVLGGLRVMQWLIPGVIGAVFILFGIFLLTKEIRFALGQATAKATVLGKDFNFNDSATNPGPRIPGFYLQCEIGASEAKPACRGSVGINVVSWLLTEQGKQIDVRYSRADGSDMRLSRSLGNWPACVFLFLVGAIVLIAWVRPMMH
jgi:hypothetical protein